MGQKKLTRLIPLTLFGIQFVLLGLTAQPFLHVPIGGAQGKDWTIVNYVDWEANGHVDARCGSKCYDGHEGTDFTLKSFAQMDSGVVVLAAADGEVTFVLDGLFDREKRSVPAKGLGNYIAIAHDNGYYSYYGHLKKNSIIVMKGDRVSAGDTLALVGSSGNSTDPHLHFELYYDSLYVVDPFKGPCGNDTSLWIQEPRYETELKVWDAGMHNDSVDIDDLRERRTTINCCPYTFPPNATSPVIFWAHLSGLRKDTDLDIEWYDPMGRLWFTYRFTFDRDWWYYYLWSDIYNTNLPLGQWFVRLLYEGEEIVRQEFRVDQTTNTLDDNSTENCLEALEEAAQVLQAFKTGRVQIYLADGRKEMPSKSADLVNRALILSGKCSDGRTRSRAVYFVK